MRGVHGLRVRVRHQGGIRPQGVHTRGRQGHRVRPGSGGRGRVPGPGHEGHPRGRRVPRHRLERHGVRDRGTGGRAGGVPKISCARLVRGNATHAHAASSPLSRALGIERVPARDRAGPLSRTRTAGARRRERCSIRRGSDSDGSSPETRGTGESTAEARRAASGREPLEDELRRRGLSSGIGAPEPRGESLTLSLEGMQSELLG